jgi:S1-C subfamily serine protease
VAAVLESTADATADATAASTAEGTSEATAEGMATAFTPGYLGIAALTVEACGARVIEVAPGSPAEAAGLRLEDVIVAFDGNLLPSRDALREYVLNTMPDTEVELVVKRGADEIVLSVTLSARPEVNPATAEATPGG